MGIIVNGAFAQMMDFAMGFMGVDLAGDDGYKFGYWPWEIPGWPCPTGEKPVRGSTPPEETPGTTDEK